MGTISASLNNRENKKLAEREVERAEYNAAARLRDAGYFAGDQVAAFGSSGVQLDGAGELAIRENFEQAQSDAMTIIYEGKMNAQDMITRSKQAQRSAAINDALMLGRMAMG